MLTDEEFKAVLERIKEKNAARTPGRWTFNSYSTIHSDHLGVLYRQLAKDWHAAGDPPVRKGGEDGWSERFYDSEPVVCRVPAHHGDSAVRHCYQNAEFIAACSVAVPALIERVEMLEKVIVQHGLCHDLHGKVGAEDFAKGCEGEQRKIYGCAPHADELARVKGELVRLRAAIDALHPSAQDDITDKMYEQAGGGQ